MPGRRVRTTLFAGCFCSSLYRGHALAFGRQRHASTRPRQQAPAGNHNRADLQAQDNIKAKVGHLECLQHGKHRHQFGGSEVQRFRGSEVQRFDAGAKGGSNHGLCLHGAIIG